MALNIFSDIFTAEPPAQPASGLDPRVAASRLRIRRQAHSAAAGLLPDEANFWHASVADLQSPPAQNAAGAAGAANDLPNLPAPLHEHLARVRAALYAPAPQADAQGSAALSSQMRLASHAMNATLVIVAFPVGAALTTYSLVRGSDFRLSAQAMAIVAAMLGAWQSGLDRLL